jgi:hypothetical protein
MARVSSSSGLPHFSFLGEALLPGKTFKSLLLGL